MIPKEFKWAYKLNEELKAYEEREYSEPSEEMQSLFTEYSDIEYQNHLKAQNESSDEHVLKEQIKREYIKQYKNFVKKNQYFFGCPIEVYEHTYQERLNNFLPKNGDSKEIDFLIKELNSIKSTTDSSPERIPEEYQEKVKYSLKRQKELILEKIDLLDYDIVEENSKYSYEIRPVSNETKNSENSILSATEKVIYLELLGVIDFIRSKANNGISINQLAKIIGLITGENEKTIQSYLNPMESSQANQKNNPMDKTDKVESIRLKLIELQFTLPEKKSK